MQFLIFACSVGLIFFVNFMSKTMLKTSLKKRIIRLLQFLRIAPVLVLFVILVLVLTYFHTKAGIRFSHAWYVAQFWSYTTFLYCSFVSTKNKICLISIIISLSIAIYITPLYHFENLFIGRYAIVSNIFGVLMFLAMWIMTSKIVKNANNENNYNLTY